jgi:hypothetical protein
MKRQSNVKIVVVALFTLLLVGGYLWSIRFLMKKSQESVLMENQILEHRRNLGEYAHVRRSLQEFEVDKTRIDRYSITQDELPGLFGLLESYGDVLDIPVTINQVGTANKDGDSLAINFSVKGDFTSVYRYLELLEQFPYMARVERLQADVLTENVNQGTTESPVIVPVTSWTMFITLEVDGYLGIFTDKDFPEEVASVEN